MPKPVIVAVFNHKGGSGKTTIAFNTAAAFHQRGKRVLMVDLDSQANLTLAVVGMQPRLHVGLLLTNSDESFHEWEDVLIQGVGQKQGLDLLPGKASMIGNEATLGMSHSIFELRDLLEDKNYDVVILDCPPSLGPLTRNALNAAHYYVVPLPAENFAWQGLDKLVKEAARIGRETNPDLKMAGVLKNKYASKTLFAKQMDQSLKDSQLPVFSTTIRTTIALMESPSQQQSIFEYAQKNSNGFTDMNNFVDELEAILFSPTN